MRACDAAGTSTIVEIAICFLTITQIITQCNVHFAFTFRFLHLGCILLRVFLTRAVCAMLQGDVLVGNASVSVAPAKGAAVAAVPEGQQDGWNTGSVDEAAVTFVPYRQQHMVWKEQPKTWILRFVPVIFAFGFFALLCCARFKSYRCRRELARELKKVELD